MLYSVAPNTVDLTKSMYVDHIFLSSQADDGLDCAQLLLSVACFLRGNISGAGMGRSLEC